MTAIELKIIVRPSILYKIVHKCLSFLTCNIQYLLSVSPVGHLARAAVAEVGLVLMKVALFLPFEVLTAYAGSTVDNTVRMP